MRRIGLVNPISGAAPRLTGLCGTVAFHLREKSLGKGVPCRGGTCLVSWVSVEEDGNCQVPLPAPYHFFKRGTGGPPVIFIGARASCPCPSCGRDLASPAPCQWRCCMVFWRLANDSLISELPKPGGPGYFPPAARRKAS